MALRLNKRVFVVGGHISKFIGAKHPDFIWKKHPDFGTKENPDIEDYVKDAVVGTLDKTGVSADVIDKAWIGNFCGELFSNQGHLGAAVAGSHEGLINKPIMRVEAACASGGLAFVSALDAVQAGCDVTLCVGAEVQTTASARDGGAYLARASHYKRQHDLDDFVFPALFARRIKAMLESPDCDLTKEDLANLSVKAYGNANKNPLAHMQAVQMDFETALNASNKNPAFLGNEELNPFLKVSDCSQVSDGAAGLILASEEGLKKLGKTEADAIEVTGYGHSTGNLYQDGNPIEMPTTRSAAQKAFEASGLSPQDVQVGEVHDCFTVTELLMTEALGLGKGTELLRSGATQIDGSIPINTGGGLVGFGHPVGATGLKQIVEIYRQMKGQCGDYQIKNIPSVGVTANMGGDDKTAVVSLFKNL